MMGKMMGKTMGQLTSELGNGLAEALDGFKFMKSQRRLVRELEGGWQSIFISAQRTSRPEFVKLSAHAHVRIDALEEACTPHIPYLTSKDAKNHPTIVINCDELLTEQSLAHGFFTDAESVAQFLQDYAKALKNDVLPWLERYSDEQVLFEELRNDDPMKWPTSDRMTRFPVLLAILAKRRDWDYFNQIADEFTRFSDSRHSRIDRSLAESISDGLREAFAE